MSSNVQSKVVLQEGWLEMSFGIVDAMPGEFTWGM